jgi:glycosyltransferase involved in cell wall biosynthesis
MAASHPKAPIVENRAMLSELVIATYNKPTYLSLALDALTRQTTLPSSVCIADDGSDERTSNVIEGFRARNPQITVRHVWHEDLGFRKTQILNQAVASSTADYLVFIDDDCLMHPTFIGRHLALASSGSFLTGSAIRLDKSLSDQLIEQGSVNWNSKGRPPSWEPKTMSERLKSMPLSPSIMGILDRLSPIRCSWAGGNASTFRSNIYLVNGFDTRMAYGGEDKEFGARLTNAGVVGRHMRYSAPLYHLEHGRGYVDPQMVAANRAIITETRRTKRVWTNFGIAE